MRILTFLFSIYLLVLACLPCGDRQECKEPVQTRISAGTGHEDHDHEEHCTPFCTCNCCAAAVCYERTAILPSLLPVPCEKSNYTGCKNPFYAAISASIWQPPRFVSYC